MTYVLIFLGIVVLNIIPFFMPATWTVLLALAATTHVEAVYLPLIGATGATLGRTILAHFSRRIVRAKILTPEARKNIDAVRTIIEKRKKLTLSGFLLYALGPFPTNYIFISYGLTSLPLRYLIVPFFFGRLLSYSLWTYIGFQIGTAYQVGDFNTIYDFYFVLTQLITILAVYLFTKINWSRVAGRLSQRGSKR